MRFHCFLCFLSIVTFVKKIFQLFFSAEAKSLINSVHSWSVFGGTIEPIRKVDNRFFFGSGKVYELSEPIRDAVNDHGVTMVL